MNLEESHKISLELGRKLIEKNPELKEWVESKIPELRESENERIRKGLVKMISNIDGGHPFENYGIIKKEALAYLEKQKEQKPLSTEETELNSIAFLEQLGYTCVPPGAEQKPTNSEKPKEWSEKEKEMLNSAIKFVEHCAFSTIGKGKNNVLAWLKSFPERFNLPPKQEWSEEDALCLEKALNAVSQVYGLNGPTSRWLKSLRPQPH